MQSFVKLKSSRNVEITLSFTIIGKSCFNRIFLNVANMSFNAFHKKNYANIFEFTECILYENQSAAT